MDAQKNSPRVEKEIPFPNQIFHQRLPKKNTMLSPASGKPQPTEKPLCPHHIVSIFGCTADLDQVTVKTSEKTVCLDFTKNGVKWNLIHP